MIFVSGIWWIFELISSALGHADYGGSCKIRIFLDLPNLLTVSILHLK